MVVIAMVFPINDFELFGGGGSSNVSFVRMPRNVSSKINTLLGRVLTISHYLFVEVLRQEAEGNSDSCPGATTKGSKG
jgi:hypothetical protein